MVEKKALGETDEPVLKHNLCPCELQDRRGSNGAEKEEERS